MEQTTETLVTSPAEEVPRSPSHAACLVHIYPSSPTMGTRYSLSDRPLIIGRSTDCDLHIDDHSVSRRHVCLEPVADGYRATDLESTNGTFVNNVKAACHRLADGDYLRVGKCIYRYLAGGNIEAEYHEELHRLAIFDALTEIPNKRCLLEFLGRELARSTRYQRPLALILLDIDHFKAINDTHGHLCGDSVLRELAARLKQNVRAEELLARYGGEEFATVLPEANAVEAVQLAERLRGQIADTPFLHDGLALHVTISLGVAVTLGDQPLTPVDLVRLADEKLYAAKHAGRNRVLA